MRIIRVYVSRSGSTQVYTSYNQFLLTKVNYWKAMNPNDYRRLVIHLNHIRQQEKSLEALYNLPYRTCKGAHLVYGSSRAMREAFVDPQFRQTLINDEPRFIIKIQAETRLTRVFKRDDGGGLQWLRNYQLTHNFFGPALMEDPIAIP